MNSPDYGITHIKKAQTVPQVSLTQQLSVLTEHEGKRFYSTEYDIRRIGLDKCGFSILSV